MLHNTKGMAENKDQIHISTWRETSPLNSHPYSNNYVIFPQGRLRLLAQNKVRSKLHPDLGLRDLAKANCHYFWRGKILIWTVNFINANALLYSMQKTWTMWLLRFLMLFSMNLENKSFKLIFQSHLFVIYLIYWIEPFRCFYPTNKAIFEM